MSDAWARAQSSGEHYLSSLKAGSPLSVVYPHCDWRVLHAPGTCQVCDGYPTWQEARLKERILFTNDPRNGELVDMVLMSGRLRDEEGWTPCPGMLFRGDSIKLWMGNQAWPLEE